jgi:hypothetical protein
LAGIDPDDFPSEKMKREFDVIVAGIKGNGEPVEIASKIWKLWRRIPA